jgi:hypothetical protein
MAKKKSYTYTKEQTDFVRFYIEQRLTQKAEAYQRAYPNCKTYNSAAASATALLKTPKMQALLTEKLEESTGELKEHIDFKILKMWVTRANYDVADILNDDGSLVRPMSELKVLGLSICIDGVDVRVDKDGNEHQCYKLADRDKAQDQLQKYIGLIKPQPTINLNVNKSAEDLTPEEEAEYKKHMKAAFPQLSDKE